MKKAGLYRLIPIESSCCGDLSCLLIDMPEQFNCRRRRTHDNRWSPAFAQPDEALLLPEDLENCSESAALKEWLEVCDAVWKRNRARLNRLSESTKTPRLTP